MDLIVKEVREKGRSKILSLSPALSPTVHFLCPPSRMSDWHTPGKKMALVMKVDKN